MPKNILIATQSLGIGGCETYILTQCKEFINIGYKVFIIANSGVLEKEFKKIGVKIFNTDFFNNNYQENIKIINKIIINENIDQIHIHPFKTFFEPCISSILNNKPYYLYFHGVSFGKYSDIDSGFSSIGKWYFPYLISIAFKYASNYIYVSEEVKKFYQDNYNLPENKGLILANSIFFDQPPNPTFKINKFIIVSRIDIAKISAIKKGINFYLEYCNNYLNNSNNLNVPFSLDILGDGNELTELKNYIKNYKNKYNINLIGSTSNVYEYIKNYDVVLGMGRCILEAISLKKLTILISYENYCGIINANSDEIDDIKYANYSGRNIIKKNINEDIEFISNITENKLNNILNSNYNYIYKNNNIKINLKNILENINEKIDYKFAKKEVNKFLELINYLNSQEQIINSNKLEIINLNNILNNKNEEINNLNSSINSKNTEIINLTNQVKDFQIQLNNIRNKTLYKLYKKIFK